MKIAHCLGKFKEIGSCLRGGELIESPFDSPFEEEIHKDADQSDDDKNFLDSNNISKPIENRGYKKVVVTSVGTTDHFKYFLDGSIRTKFIGEYVEGSASFPILLSEVAVGVVKKDGGSLNPFKKSQTLHFIFPHKSSGYISDDVFDRLEEIKRKLREEDSELYIEFLKTGSGAAAKDLRWSMQGKARSIMHDKEHEVAHGIERGTDEWIIMDGAIRKPEFLGLERTIGLAKSFSRKPLFDFGGIPLTIASYLKSLNVGERSVVFKKQGATDDVSKKVGFWFLRIRESPPMMEPLGGIVKIDYNTESDELTEEEVAEINKISAEILRMKIPSVYPWPRWPNYVYPVRLAELYMSSSFLNKEYLSYLGRVMKSAIRAQ